MNTIKKRRKQEKTIEQGYYYNSVLFVCLSLSLSLFQIGFLGISSTQGSRNIDLTELHPQICRSRRSDHVLFSLEYSQINKLMWPST